MASVLHEEEAFNVIYGYRCNYSCEGCCVGSDYVTDNTRDPDLNKILAAIKLLPKVIRIKESDNYWQQGMITLLGGEPMMYWHERIVPIARAVREQFPNARLNIFSNGHLLSRNTDEIINFIDEISASLTISQHLIGDINSPLGERWTTNIQKFLSNPKIEKIHDEHYAVRGNTKSNIHFYKSTEWFTWYKKTTEGIKPHVTNDPQGSMEHGCASGSTCSSLFENRLYKCSSLAMLPGLLNYLGQSQDPSWEKYLKYPYIDMFDLDEEQIKHHIDNYGKPVTYCDMCNNQPSNVMQWTDRKQWMILKNK